MITATIERVEKNTTAAVNEKIRLQTQASIARYAKAGAPAIRRRLRELDREWDIERYLEVLAPTFALTGVLMGLLRGRKWLLLPGVVLSFLVQHAVHGWCPPLAALRRMGVRTRREIDEERYALKALRGDFSGLPPDAPRNRITRVDAILDAIRS